MFCCHASFISGRFRSLVQFQVFLSYRHLLVRPLSLSPPRCVSMSSSKGYESRAVQTTFSPPCSPCPVVSPRPSPLDRCLHSEVSTSTVEPSLETPDNPAQNSGSLMSYLSTPDHSIFDSRRVFKTRLPPNFPPRATQIVSQRISSLPETAPSFSVMSQISSQQRVVTMPENVRSQRLEKEFVHYLPEYGDTPVDSSNSFSISDGNSSFARADATGTDISHSSSSPSSPDSVVIIQNKHHISQAFLRQTNVQTKAKNDEGMVEGLREMPLGVNPVDPSPHRMDDLGKFSATSNPRTPWTFIPPLRPLSIVSGGLSSAFRFLTRYSQRRGRYDHRRTRQPAKDDLGAGSRHGQTRHYAI